MAYTTINKPSDYFNTVLYTGNGSTQSITGVGFQPDFTWIKDRSDAFDHRLTDSVRGATKLLYSSLTNAEATEATSLTSFDSDGFSLGSANGVNTNTDNHVAWNWLAGSTAVSNTDGSITSNVSASTTSGFSIVSYTGTGANATVGHGLGVAPAMIIVKNRTSAVEQWQVLHQSLNTSAGQYLLLSATNAVGTASSVWNSTEPTSSVFSVGTAGGTNGNTNNLIAYCFAEKKDYSKFGSYAGNGSNTDNTFVYTGFKPAFLLIKDTANNSWTMMDNKMNPYNSAYTNFLLPDLANAQSSGVYNMASFYSNGFKIGDNNSNYGGSGRTYIYMAFAENPLVTTGKVPATAR